MEQQASLITFSRSLETFGLCYRTVVSYGDRNIIKAIRKSNPYVGLNVEKRECINHVGKFLVLQKYFTTVPEKRKAAWATFYHCTSSDESWNHSCTSSDESWNHSCCSERSLSWCFFRRAEALGVPATSHPEMISTYLSPLVAEHIKPVYERLIEDELLRRCTEGQTQNANESAHALIWSRCPKHLVEVSVSVGIVEFNMGSLASKYFLDLKKIECRSSD
ncbi:hypothetical protein BgiBS90_005584 [Biomphalaria glabrata]|nr:hypothetical protein BgiBS90_005584 [Biomphalaria glabrata]